MTRWRPLFVRINVRSRKAKRNSHFPAVMSAFDPTRPLATRVKKAPDDAGALNWLERGNQYFARTGGVAQSNR
jgi:hypothetical protein